MLDTAVSAALTSSHWHGFEEAVHRETGHLFRLAYSILGDAGEAEDAVQDTLFRAWRAWDSLDDEQRRGAWLTRICVNRSLDIRDRLRVRLVLRAPMPADAPASAGTPHIGDPGALRDPDLDRVYSLLPRHQRAVLALHYGHGYSLDECADVLGCRPGTVRTHLSRALARFRKELGGD